VLLFDLGGKRDRRRESRCACRAPDVVQEAVAADQADNDPMPISRSTSDGPHALFEGFENHRVDTTQTTINCRVGGAGPPLLVLHGCPQTHLMWHKLVPTLARRFTVVASDLRGYGDSSKPRGAADHTNYSFRAMAADQHELMATLGFERFSAVGHDRGARVLHRMALDQPDILDRLVLLDILPTTVLYDHADAQFAQAYWEWFFFVQRPDFPERVLSADPERFLRHELGDLVDNGTIPQTVWGEYLRVLDSELAMHTMCEDYRAGASIDLQHDRADADLRIACPVQILWGARNPIWERFDMLAIWRAHARAVQGAPIDSGHYLPEEAPDATLKAILPFLSQTTHTA
jgi:haloacetate dehalogenase